MTPTVIIISITTGLISGFLASVAFAWIQAMAIRKKNNRLFGSLAGKYEGYGYMPGEKVVNFDQPQAIAQVSYPGGGLLNIEVTHPAEPPGQHTWIGTITMSSEYEDRGDLPFRYITFPEDERRFGFKRVIMDRELDEFWLRGELPHGDEILARAGVRPKVDVEPPAVQANES